MTNLRPIYTHVAKDGTNTHIDVAALRNELLNNMEFDKYISLVPVDVSMAQSYLRDNVIDPVRVVQLMRRHMGLPFEKWEPMILCQDNISTAANGALDVFHADGHHRYVMHSIMRLPFARTYLVPYAGWQKYRVTGLPSLTQQELRDSPVLKRNY